jgi:hypothetical protein
MTFRLTDEQVIPAWRTLTIEVVFAPKTGSIKPWELYGCFTFPHARRVHWASFKTEAAAQKKAAALRVKYANRYGVGA